MWRKEKNVLLYLSIFSLHHKATANAHASCEVGCSSEETKTFTSLKQLQRPSVPPEVEARHARECDALRASGAQAALAVREADAREAAAAAARERERAAARNRDVDRDTELASAKKEVLSVTSRHYPCSRPIGADAGQSVIRRVVWDASMILRV